VNVPASNSTDGAQNTVAARSTPLRLETSTEIPPQGLLSKRDPVHEIFHEIAGKPLKRKCTLCTKEVAKSGGGLTNLYDHLSRKHVDAFNVYKEKQRVWREAKSMKNTTAAQSTSTMQVGLHKNYFLIITYCMNPF
jgi:hypothetical protein